jgi:predicted transcriptional regulator
MNTIKNIQPTDSELEILQVLWEKGSATVRDVHKELEEKRNVGYTTTLKTMQIMTEKGLVERDTSNRTHIYVARISKDFTQKHFMSKIIDGFFSGSTSRLVMGALDSKNISKEEIEEIKNFLNQFENLKQ